MSASGGLWCGFGVVLCIDSYGMTSSGLGETLDAGLLIPRRRTEDEVNTGKAKPNSNPKASSAPDRGGTQ